MKVLHVITSLGRGGAERQLANLVEAAQGTGDEHVVVHLRLPDDFRSTIEATGTRVLSPRLGGRRPWLSGSVAVARLIRRERPDLIQTWLFDANLAATVGRVVARRVPVVTTLHNLDYEPATIRVAGLPPRKIEVLRRIDGALARFGGTRYVACSASVATSAHERFGVPRSRLQVIYNSVDPARLVPPDADRARTRAALGVPDGALLFVNVARLDPQKAQDTLLDAFAILGAELRNAHLVLVGDGPSREALDRRASAGDLVGRASLVGRRDDVGAILHAADAFVLPSHFEGFPVALIEAMGCGLPAIGSRIGPIEEVIREGVNGLLVQPGDVGDLVTAMRRLATDETERQALAARGQADVVAAFSTAKILDEWRGLWSDLVHDAQRLPSG